VHEIAPALAPADAASAGVCQSDHAYLRSDLCLNRFPKNVATPAPTMAMVFSIAIVKAFLVARHYYAFEK
jgi:hypothetical protein